MFYLYPEKQASTCTKSLLPKECLCNFAVYTSLLILDRSNFVLQDMLESMQEENPSEPIRLLFEWMHFIQKLVVFMLEMYQEVSLDNTSGDTYMY